MSLIPRWLQFDVDPRKVIEKVGNEKAAKYQADSQTATLWVSSEGKDAGRIFWHTGRDYLAGILENYNPDAVVLVANSYGLERMEYPVSEQSTVKELSFPLKGLKTEDFDKAVKGCEKLYRAIEHHARLAEGLKCQKEERKAS